MWGEQVCSHFSFCINSPKVQHVLPGRTYLNFISGGVLNFIPGGNMTDHIVFFFVSMEEIVCEYLTWLSQKMIRMIHTWTEHETDLKPGWEHCFVSIQIYWRCILSWKQVEFLFFFSAKKVPTVRYSGSLSRRSHTSPTSLFEAIPQVSSKKRTNYSEGISEERAIHLEHSKHRIFGCCAVCAAPGMANWSLARFRRTFRYKIFSHHSKHWVPVP